MDSAAEIRDDASEYSLFSTAARSRTSERPEIRGPPRVEEKASLEDDDLMSSPTRRGGQETDSSYFSSEEDLPILTEEIEAKIKEECEKHFHEQLAKETRELQVRTVGIDRDE